MRRHQTLNLKTKVLNNRPHGTTPVIPMRPALPSELQLLPKHVQKENQKYLCILVGTGLCVSINVFLDKHKRASMWHSWLNHSLQSQQPIQTLAPGPAVPLLLQLAANIHGKITEDDPSTQTLTTHLGNLNETRGFSLAPAHCGHWEIHQQTED